MLPLGFVIFYEALLLVLTALAAGTMCETGLYIAE